MPARATPASLNATPAVDADIGERAVARVAVQAVRLRVVRDEQIHPAVAVVVEHRDAEPFRRADRTARRARVTSSNVPSPRLR